MTHTIDFYWDVGSTNSYFAFHLIQPVASKHGARIVPHPFNLGYVFRKQSYVLMEEPKAKIANRIVDLHRWARRYRLPFRMPSTFPIKTSRALRAVLAARSLGGAAGEWSFMGKLLSAYWEHDDASIVEHAGLRKVAAAAGLDADEIERLAETEEIRAELARETDEGLARGVFGAPTFFVGGEMFWGKDRMDFVDEELTRSAASVA